MTAAGLQHSARTQDNLDLTAAVVRLVGLTATVRCGPVRAGLAADWDEPRRTLTLRPDLPMSAAAQVLDDLYELLTLDGHQSWSVPAPCLRVVS